MVYCKNLYVRLPVNLVLNFEAVLFVYVTPPTWVMAGGSCLLGQVKIIYSFCLIKFARAPFSFSSHDISYLSY